MPEKQAILPRLDTVMYVHGKKRANIYRQSPWLWVANHKTYKWSDTEKLLDFGDYNYEYETYWKEPQTGKILVTDGVEDDQDIGKKIYLRGKCSVTDI